MPKFDVSIEIKLRGSVSVEAETQDKAFEKADSKMYWAYAAGDPASHKDVNITDCEIEVEGDELDLNAYREPEES